MDPTSRQIARPVRVLIADRYLSSALALKELLVRHAGLELEVHAVLDGHDALSVGEAELPDLVILADDLPILAAGDLAAALRQRRADSHLPLIVLLACDRQAAVAAKLNDQFDLVMIQPVDPGLLLELVRGALWDPAAGARLGA